MLTGSQILELPGAALVIRADAMGPPGGPPVLLAHGGGQTRRSWGTALTALAQRGARAVAMDLRGHGESDWSAEGAYEPADFAADLVNVVPALGPRPVILIGASMGGWASLLAAPQLGDSIAGLILVDVVPRLRNDGAQRVVDFMRSAPDGFPDLEAAADAVAAYLSHRARPALTEGLRRNLRQRDDGRWVWHWDPRLVQGWSGDVTERQRDLEEAAARVKVPMLLVRGLRSDVVDDEGVARFREIVPELQVIDLAGAAHTAAADDNDAFVAALLEFVSAALPR